MSIKTPALLAIAALFLTSPALLSAQGASSDSDATAEAAKMVSATAVFVSTIDSQKATPGTPVKVQLKGKVRLANGVELPSGTFLVGQVADDSTQTAKGKLALRFTEAKLKNGQTVPVKVTIFTIRDGASDTQSAEANTIEGWDKQAVGVDQTEAIPGIGLHSKIASPNSGVFVSTKKDTVKVSQGSGIGLAIAPLSGSGQNSVNGY